MQATTAPSMSSETISASQNGPFPIHDGYSQSHNGKQVTQSYGYENTSGSDFSTPYHGMESPSFSNSNQKRPMSSPCPETLAKRSKRPSSVLGIEKSDKHIDSSLFQAILSTDEIDVATAESMQNEPSSNATQSTESPMDKPSSVPHPADGEDSIASLFLENSNFLDDIKNYTSELCPIECLVLVERCRPFNSDTIFMSYFREQYLDPILTHLNGGPPLNADFGRDAYTSLYTMQSYSWRKAKPCDVLVEDTPQIYQILKKAKCMSFEERHVAGNTGDCIHGGQLLSAALNEFSRLERLRKGKCKQVTRHLLVLTCSPISLDDDQAQAALRDKHVNVSVFSPLDLACYAHFFSQVNKDAQAEPIHDKQWKTVLLSAPLLAAKTMGSQASRDHEEYLAKAVADARQMQNGTLSRVDSNGMGQSHPSPHSAPQPLQQQSPLIGPQGGHGSAGPAPFFTHPAPNQANSPRCNQNWMSPGQAVSREAMPCPSPSSCSNNNSFSNSGMAGQRSGPGSVHAPPMSPQTNFRRGPASNGPASNQPPSYENPMSWSAVNSVASTGPMQANSPLAGQSYGNVDTLVPSAASTPQQLPQASPRNKNPQAASPYEYQSSPHPPRYQQPPSPYSYQQQQQQQQRPVYPAQNSPYQTGNPVMQQQQQTNYPGLNRSHHSPYQYSPQTAPEMSENKLLNTSRPTPNKLLSGEVPRSEQQTPLEQMLIKQQTSVNPQQRVAPPVAQQMRRGEPSPSGQMSRAQWEQQQAMLAMQRSAPRQQPGWQQNPQVPAPSLQYQQQQQQQQQMYNQRPQQRPQMIYQQPQQPPKPSPTPQPPAYPQQMYQQSRAAYQATPEPQMMMEQTNGGGMMGYVSTSGQYMPRPMQQQQQQQQQRIPNYMGQKYPDYQHQGYVPGQGRM